MALEIALYKRPNEPSGIEFLDVDRLRINGVLFVKGFVDNSFIAAHNTACYEKGVAEGLIEGDMIIQVNMTSGPPYGIQGGGDARDQTHLGGHLPVGCAPQD